MKNWLRLNYGMFWARTTPPLPLNHLAVIIACILTYALVVKFDNLEQRAAQMDKQVELKDSYMNALLSCINGDGRFVWGDTMFACSGGELGKI